MSNIQRNINASDVSEVYSFLYSIFAAFNEDLFRDILKQKLPDCIITLQRKVKTQGYFSQERWCQSKGKKCHEIGLNPSYFATHPLLNLMQIMVHQQCHLWQFEYGKPTNDANYHNKEWTDTMIKIGLQPNGIGKSEGKTTGQEMSQYALSDGAFIQSCIKFVSQNNKLQWVDVKAEKYSNNYVEQGILSILTPEQQNILTVPISKGIAGIEIKTEYLKIRHAKGKIKYSCKCRKPEVNIWGRENLNIICGICKHLFKMEDKKI